MAPAAVSEELPEELLEELERELEPELPFRTSLRTASSLPACAGDEKNHVTINTISPRIQLSPRTHLPA
jgi:hypothetical protein